MKYSLNPEKRLKAILESPTYRLAQEDLELLNQNDLRPVRLQLELLKPERVLREQGIQSTVVVFGSLASLMPLQRKLNWMHWIHYPADRSWLGPIAVSGKHSITNKHAVLQS